MSVFQGPAPVNLPVWAPCAKGSAVRACILWWDPNFPFGGHHCPHPGHCGCHSPAFGAFAQHFLGSGTALGGCDCLYKSPLHSSQCCLKGCLVNRIIKLSCRQATEINGGPLGMSLIRFPARVCGQGLWCCSRGDVLLPLMCSPRCWGLLEIRKKDVKLLESIQRKW